MGHTTRRVTWSTLLLSPLQKKGLGNGREKFLNFVETGTMSWARACIQVCNYSIWKNLKAIFFLLFRLLWNRKIF